MVAGAIAFGAVLFYGTPAPRPAVPVDLPVTQAPSEVMTVHVSGAVLRPGLVELAPGARVADVIAAAGGSAPGANLAALNLAAPVRDGDQVVVPAIGDEVENVAAAQGKVRLNTASPQELEQIPGVGPVLAARIVAAREAAGGFSVVEDLLDVSGIGEAKLAALRDFVVVP